MTYKLLGEAAAVKAAGAWRRYRARGACRARIVDDFLIGAHALRAADRVIAVFTGDISPDSKCWIHPPELA